ncbi:hypothetical protein E4U42_007742 [Claviceps africana]|uniref:Partial AB-hydrolase lipase domain-containing protein n=1 Tax=Claviceps africana TaxID=83212 RepID=A0A8K0J0T5_9HYPO|nr:hypothetical protein E4U42_007742 [Claviceps africana]
MPASGDALFAASPNPRRAFNNTVSAFPHSRRRGLTLEAEESGDVKNGTMYNANCCANDPILIAEEKATQRLDSACKDEAEFEVVYSSRSTFPALPIYGPPSFVSSLTALLFRISAFFLSLAFLCFVISASLVTSIPRMAKQLLFTMTTGDANRLRPHYEEERRRAEARWQKQKEWEHKSSAAKIGGDLEGTVEDYPPTEGGKDRLVCDVAYYARRVGLEVDVFHVRTEDGFLLDLWHVYDPKEYIFHDAEAEADADADADAKEARRAKTPRKALKPDIQKPKFPVLLMHGLLQSSGAFCCNDDESLAFWLCKSGFDVWLGNNRCGTNPSHESLTYSDPRMWSWTIQHMGIHDLPALTDQVLAKTGFEKVGLICHSQGTAQTLVALSKDQRPELGQKFTVFCALAPAAYAGSLVKKYYFRFINQLSPCMYYLVFGRHAFIPFMMQMHSLLNSQLYGWLGYQVFSFLFDWTDSRWDRGLRDRLFQFAPVYVSAETMRWWLGKDGFASHKCILSRKDVAEYDEEADDVCSETEQEDGAETVDGNADLFEHSHGQESSERCQLVPAGEAWYNEQVPPFAMWVCGSDQLVDGKRLLMRFGTGQEPHVTLVHSKVIEQYEHLDVIWAIDAVEQVFGEVRDVLWRTCYDQDLFRVPAGCDGGPA